MLTVVTAQKPTPAAATTDGSLIDEIVRDAARRMLAAALEAEVAAYIAAHADPLDTDRRRLVVRNGHTQPRKVLTSSGAVEVHAPRVNDKRVDEATGKRRRFSSAILPAWCRKSPKIAEAAFKLAYGAKFGTAVAKMTDDLDEVLAFCDLPAEHWIHLRTTNPIESTLATVRHRTTVTKGPGSKAAGLAMAFRLVEAAQARWCAVNAPHLVAVVRAAARFERGRLLERRQDQAAA